MLKLKNVSVTVEENEIVKDVTLDFTVDPGRFFALFGPNGSGKSTLFRAIMGFSNYDVSGDILLEGKKINDMSIDERVKEGLVYMYQHPPKLKGIKLNDVIEESTQEDSIIKFKDNIKKLNVLEFYNRDVNSGLSGGELKRSELFTLSALPNTKVFLFDEPDSGVDIDNLKRIGKYMDSMLKEKDAIGIIVTHTGDILKYLDAQKGAVIYDGVVKCKGKAESILKCIKKEGYESCLNCKGLDS